MPISEAVRQAFWSKVEVQQTGTILGLDEGLEAAFAASQDAPAFVPMVKPLEWGLEPQRPEDMPKWNAIDPLGKTYSVVRAWWGSMGKWGFVGEGKFHNTEESAKAAVQADYDRRILSALAPVPQATEGWQDITSAPKDTSRDGLLVDIWLEPIPERQALFFRPATEGRRLTNAWHVERSDYTGWRNAGSFNGREINWRATHWMPLPAAPTPKAEGRNPGLVGAREIASRDLASVVNVRIGRKAEGEQQ